MNIHLANAQLHELNSKSKNQALTSSTGTKTAYYHKLIKIFNDFDITYAINSVTETKWSILHLDFSEKLCKGCKSTLTFIGMSKGFLRYCSGSCGAVHRKSDTRKGFATFEGWNASRETVYRKYGVMHQLHIPEIFNRQQHHRYKTYTIISPIGNEYKVQGYERFVIPALWNTYGESDVVSITSMLPKIDYTYNNKIRKYYPDGYIKSKNIIVEVKSTYTIKSELLIPKMEACVQQGYTPLVYLYHNKIISVLTIDDVRRYTEALTV